MTDERSNDNAPTDDERAFNDAFFENPARAYRLERQTERFWDGFYAERPHLRGREDVVAKTVHTHYEQLADLKPDEGAARIGELVERELEGGPAARDRAAIVGGLDHGTPFVGERTSPREQFRQHTEKRDRAADALSEGREFEPETMGDVIRQRQMQRRLGPRVERKRG